SRGRAGDADRGAAVRAAGGQLRGRPGSLRRGADLRDSARDRAPADRAWYLRGLRDHPAAHGAGGAGDAAVLSGVHPVPAAVAVRAGFVHVAAARADALRPDALLPAHAAARGRLGTRALAGAVARA